MSRLSETDGVEHVFVHFRFHVNCNWKGKEHVMQGYRDQALWITLQTWKWRPATTSSLSRYQDWTVKQGNTKRLHFCKHVPVRTSLSTNVQENCLSATTAWQWNLCVSIKWGRERESILFLDVSTTRWIIAACP